MRFTVFVFVGAGLLLLFCSKEKIPRLLDNKILLSVIFHSVDGATDRYHPSLLLIHVFSF